MPLFFTQNSRVYRLYSRYLWFYMFTIPPAPLSYICSNFTVNIVKTMKCGMGGISIWVRLFCWKLSFGIVLKLSLCVNGSATPFRDNKKAWENVNLRGHLTPTQSHRNRHKYRYKTILIYFHTVKIKGFKTAKFKP